MVSYKLNRKSFTIKNVIKSIWKIMIYYKILIETKFQLKSLSGNIWGAISVHIYKNAANQLVSIFTFIR